MRLLSAFIVGIIMLSSTTTNAQKVYREKHRPQFHFSPAAHWMNDPNGMVFFDGEYHLFYQYFPDSTVWGPMHWGHAVSKDLVHWQHLPTALFPDSLGYIFSGSVVVDKTNSSGLQEGATPPLIAIFTYHDPVGEKAGKNDFQTQGIAYSSDKDRTWKKYSKNPVLKNPGIRDFRDPKVMWHEPSKHWIMTMAAMNEIKFYKSTNLIDWELASSFGKDAGSHGGVWECPDLFKMPLKDGTDKWVLLVSINPGAPNGGSGTQYFVGQFDGTTFTNDNSKDTQLWLDYGTDNYAGVTWNNAPDNRRIFLGWMSNWLYAQTVPTDVWRSAMTVPRDLMLELTSAGTRLFSKPVKEMASLRGKPKKLNLSMASYPVSLSEVMIEIDLSKTTSNDFSFQLSNNNNESISLGFDKKSNQFYIDRTKLKDNSFSKEFTKRQVAPRLQNTNIVKLHLLIDDASVELFADDGSIVMTDIFFPKEKFNKLSLGYDTGHVSIRKAIMYPLKSIW